MKWKELQPGYEVSDHGHVRSKYRILRGQITSKGYVRVNVRGKKRLVHRLVLEAFVGPCPDGMECRHLDGNPANNKLENLCWGTSQENADDCKRHGTERHYVGEEAGNSKLTVAQVKKIRSTKIGYGDQSRLARKYGVRQGTIWAILNRQTWRHV